MSCRYPIVWSNSTPTANTDPLPTIDLDTDLRIRFEEFCDTNGIDEHDLTVPDSATARPEDLDVDIVGSQLVFILTNNTDPTFALPLSVALTNNGGHDADD